jgi:sterol desaturase/sphingolipid hydroxylase (fatty acid hydroxylase superfamily)
MSGAAAIWSVLSPLLIVAGAAVLIALERRYPHTPGQRFLRRGLWDDFFGYTLIQSYLLGLLIARVISWMDGMTGLSRWHLIAGWPVALQVLLFVVTHDLYIYCFHRWQHRSAVLWRIHEAHHATEDVDWLSGARSHALEILINQTIEFAPIVLLGAAPEVALIKMTVGSLWGMYIHSNVDVRSGRLQWLLNGPEMHRWHHSADRNDGTNVNFSTKLAIWDWLFGTAYRPAEKPASYGLGASGFPSGYLRQQLYAFRPPERSSIQRSDAGSTTMAASKQVASPSTATKPRLRTAWLWDRSRAR